MRALRWSVLLGVCLLLGKVVASSIGVGLDWRTGLFVQEYWQAGKPRYLIANLTREPARITVQTVNIDAREGGQAFREADPIPQKPIEVLAGPWEVPAGGVADVDASPLLGKGLVDFRSGAKRLGLLDLPKAAPVTATPNTIATNNGINGSGGRQARMWCEHAALRVPSGADIEVKLLTAANQGTMKLSRKLTPAEEKDGVVTRPAHIPPSEAVCGTLTITSTDNAAAIDTGKPLKEQALHAVVLRLKAPDVVAPTLVTFGGWTQHGGGGFWLIRGVVVEPRPDK
ncbi:MAG: hypothetical protein FJ291_18415 [Planctomycetes bacterium]|nr:hypothetical protein [Planctomycetota bacterium]